MQARLDHVCVGVESIHGVAPFVVNELGGVNYIGGPGNGFFGCQWMFPNRSKLEAIQPTASVSEAAAAAAAESKSSERDFLVRFLRTRGQSVHHVTFTVSDLESWRKRAENAGYTVTGYDTSDPAWHEFFLMPKQCMGVVVQFAEEFKIGQGWNNTFPFPAVPRIERRSIESQKTRIVVHGLRLRATRKARAVDLLTNVLGGKASKVTSTRHRFVFPNSPMSITVDVDESGQKAEGVECIELATLDGSVILQKSSVWSEFQASFPNIKFEQMPIVVDNSKL